MRVLVIGGTRFIGPPVVRRLVEGGHEVAVFHRGETQTLLTEGVRRLHGDRRRLAEHAPELWRFAPEVVVDMVPMNERDARGLMDVFRGVAERVVAVSSQDVYRAYDIVRGLRPGPPDAVPLDEDAPLRERLYPYGREGVEEYEKILVERVAMSEPDLLPGTVLRLPMVYGPGDYQHRLYPYLRRIDDGRTAIPIGESVARWRWSKGYVEDVAAAIALAATDERAIGRTYNVGEAETLPLAEWVQQVVHAIGFGEVIVVPDAVLPDHLGLSLNVEQDLVIDTARIRIELGFKEKVPRDEAIRRTVEWERYNPPDSLNPEEFDYAAEDAALAALDIERGVDPVTG